MPLLPTDAGIYAVVYHLDERKLLEIGKLGKFEFQPGLYFYCGSAQGSGGLDRRIHRHLTGQTRTFWHIDYLKRIVKALRVWTIATNDRAECELIRYLAQHVEILHPVTRFGASDCTEKCISHLLHIEEVIALDPLFEKIKSAFPSAKEVILD